MRLLIVLAQTIECARCPVAGGELKNPPVRAHGGKRHAGVGQCDSPYRVDAVRSLGGRIFQKLPPCGCFGIEVDHFDTGAGQTARGLHLAGDRVDHACL